MAEDKDNQYVAGKVEKIISPKMSTGEPNTGYSTRNVFNTHGTENGKEYPITQGPLYIQPKPRVIGGHRCNDPNEDPRVVRRHEIGRAAVDHRLGDNRNLYSQERVVFGPDGEIITGQALDPYTDTSPTMRKPEYFIKNRLDHFVRDVPQGLGGERDIPNTEPFVDENVSVNRQGYVNGGTKQTPLGVFSGSTTNVNALNKETAQEILDAGTYGKYERDRVRNGNSKRNPPISPEYPFHRMTDDKKDDYVAQESLFNAYNRTRLPVADQEWRKGFRYLFFTRPECYLMFRDGGVVDLCDQAFYDEDFASSYTRMPHIIKLLSPWYVTGSFPLMGSQNNELSSSNSRSEGQNWNFLLSNRVQGLSTNATTMSIVDAVGKSVEGYTVTPAKFLETRQGSTIDLTFTDTRNLEIYEYARLWMLYMYKRQKGIFLPPYNGYAKENSFRINGNNLKGPLTGAQYTRMHPYDRALEYCASLYDIVTDETGTKILYWCKYYGIYPTSVNPSLNNEANGPITSMQTGITFKYHYKLENNNKTLVEFNHDAGLTNNIGQINTDKVTSSLPFLLRDQAPKNPDSDPFLPKYIGAAGMFTGSPYVVMVASRPDPLDNSKIITVPSLRFMNVPKLELDKKINMDITNTKIDQSTRNVVAYAKNEALVASRSASDVGAAIAKAVGNII